MTSEFSPAKSRIEIVIDFITDNKWWLTAMAAVIIGLGVFGRIPFPKIMITDDMRVVIVISLITLLAMFLPTYSLVKRYLTPKWDIIAAVDTSEPDPLEIYAVGRQKMDELEVEDGEITSISGAHGRQKHIVRLYDPVENVAVANWMGQLDDLEVMTVRENLKSLRVNRNARIKLGYVLYARFEEIVRKAVSVVYQKETDKLSSALGYNPSDYKRVIKDTVFEEMDEELSEDIFELAEDTEIELNERRLKTSDTDEDGGDDADDE